MDIISKLCWRHRSDTFVGLLVLLSLGAGFLFPLAGSGAQDIGDLLREADLQEVYGHSDEVLRFLETATRLYEQQAFQRQPLGKMYQKAEELFDVAEDVQGFEFAYAAYKLSAVNAPESPYRRYALLRTGDVNRLTAALPENNVKQRDRYLDSAAEDYEQALGQCPASYTKELADDFPESWPEMARAEFAAYWIADYHYRQGRILQAEEDFNALIEQFPAGLLGLTDNAVYRIGQCYMDRAEWKSAREYFADPPFMTTGSPLWQSAQLRLADSNAENSEHALARRIDIYQAVMDAKRGAPDLRLQAAERLLALFGELHLTDRGSDVYRNAKLLFSDAAPEQQLRIRIRHAQLLAESGRYAEAYTMLVGSRDQSALLTELPATLQLKYWRTLALTSYQQREYAAATVAYEQRKLLEPLPDTDFLRLNRAYIENDQALKAVLLLDEWLATAPAGDWATDEARLLLGNAHRGLKDYPRAIQQLEQALASSDTTIQGRALLALGNVYFEQRNYAKFQEIYQRLTTEYGTVLDPGLMISLHRLAQLIPELGTLND